MSGIYRRPTVIAGVAIALVMAATGIFAPLLTPHDPQVGDLSARLCPPFACDDGNKTYFLGTDHLGRDVLSRIVASFRISLYIGLLGTFLGAAGAWLLVIARRVRGTSFAADAPHPLFGVPLWGLAILTYSVALFPSLVIMIAIAAVIGPSYGLVIVCAGVFASLLPMALAYSSVQGDNAPSNPVGFALRGGIALAPAGFSLAFLMGLFVEFELSSWGAGVPRPTPSLGTMVADASLQIVTWWWMAVFPVVIGLVSAGAFFSIVFPVSRVLSSLSGSARPAALGIAPAGFRIRLAAGCIDLAAVLVVIVLIFVMGSIDLPIQIAAEIAAAFFIAWNMAIYSILVISPGKRAVGLRVLRLDGSPAGWGRKLCRCLVSLPTLYIIDLLMLACRKDRRALHDLAFDTIVVRRRDLERPSVPSDGAET